MTFLYFRKLWQMGSRCKSFRKKIEMGGSTAMHDKHRNHLFVYCMTSFYKNRRVSKKRDLINIKRYLPMKITQGK